jgi:enoyl-CoA hydratase/carnithine racemase
MIEIRMDGPGKNSLGTAMMTFLIERLRDAAGAPVLLTGAGDAFSAGLNLKEVAGLDEAGMLAFLRLLEDCMSAVYLYPGPTVAAVNGHAIAGGCVLALCCDHRVMTKEPRAKIGLNETALGLRFPPRVLAIVRARLSRRHETRVLLGADLVGAEGALSLGLVDEIADDPVAAARARLQVLASHPAEAYALNKQDLRGAAPSDLCPDDQQDRALRAASKLWCGPAVKKKILRALGR